MKVFYCDQLCQKQHWKGPFGHRKFCMPNPDAPAASAECGECVVCVQPISKIDAQVLPCGHVFHSRCVDGICALSPKAQCPLCRADILTPGQISWSKFKERNAAINEKNASKEDSVISGVLLAHATLCGHPEAQLELGDVSYGQGKVIQAMYLWCMAAEQGCSKAQVKFGKELFRRKEYAESLMWMRKAHAAGEADASYFLGVCYADGLGVEPDFERSAELLHQVDTNVDAMWRLFALMHDKKVKADKETEFAQLHRFCEHGIKGDPHYRLATACALLASCYSCDDPSRMDYEVEYSPKLAFQWALASTNYKDDFEKGTPECVKAKEMCDEAVLMVARCYACGFVVEKNLGEAVKYFDRSTERECAGVCCFELGDYEKAAKYFSEKTISQRGLVLLGELRHRCGDESAVGFSLVKLAADAGHMPSCRFLGRMYMDGTCTQGGVRLEKDEALAMHYNTLAVNLA
jgi:TPR repeat protein